jgi:hypothetical protein
MQIYHDVSAEPIGRTLIRSPHLQRIGSLWQLNLEYQNLLVQAEPRFILVLLLTEVDVA